MTTEYDVGAPTEPADHPPSTHGCVTVEHAHRVRLWGGAMAVGVVAVSLPLASSGAATFWQILIGLVALVALGSSAWFRPGLLVAAVLITGSAGLALLGTATPLLSVMMAGVCALGSMEAMALLRQWRTAGRLTLAAEKRHLRASLVRVAAGTGAGAGSALFGLVELPAPGIIAAAGVAAAAALIVSFANRS